MVHTPYSSWGRSGAPHECPASSVHDQDSLLDSVVPAAKEWTAHSADIAGQQLPPSRSRDSVAACPNRIVPMPCSGSSPRCSASFPQRYHVAMTCSPLLSVQPISWSRLISPDLPQTLWLLLGL